MLAKQLVWSFLALSSGVTISAAQQLLHEWEGPDPLLDYVHSAVNGGDLNLDGMADVVILTTLGVSAFDSVSGLQLWTVALPPATREVSRGGDVSGDGRSDVLMTDGSTGTLQVLSGLDGSLLQALPGPAGSLAGVRLRALGDVNNDQRDDFLIGTPNDFWQGFEEAGRVRVISGADYSTLLTIRGSAEEQWLGRSLAGLGDVDGDQVPDFAAASHRTSISGEKVEVFSGATGAVISTFSPPGLPSTPIVANAGDVDGDGRDDVVVAADSSSTNKVLVFRADNAQVLLKLPVGCQGRGVVANGAGDVDGDGLDDILLGGTPQRGDVDVVSVLSEVTLFEFKYQTGNPGWISLDGMGDLDGDGKSEMLIALGATNKVMLISQGYSAEIGTRFAFGDGTGAPCPCGNTGTSGAGCMNSNGVGAQLSAFGSTSVSAVTFDSPLTFTGLDLAQSNPASALLFSGTGLLGGGLGVPFHGGLRAIAPPVKRLGIPDSWCSEGYTSWYTDYQPKGGWGPGDTQYFQVWYRDPVGPCKTTNLTNAVEVSFTP